MLRTLALALSAGGRTGSAIRALSQALRSGPCLVEWQRDLGAICLAAGRWDAAIEAFDRYLEVRSGDVTTRLYRAEALAELGEHARAKSELLGCLEREPENPRAHELLAQLYRQSGHHEAELAHLQAQVNGTGPDADRLSRLAAAYWRTGQLETALACFQESLAKEANASTYSALLIATLHDEAQTPESLRRAHQAGAALCARGAQAARSYRNTPDPNRRLRIGYLSGEFIGVPAYHLIFPLLEHARPAHFETYCYHTRPTIDAATRSYSAAAHFWRDVRGRDAQSVARLIRRDGIDILVDLSGHFPQNALDVFARKPAPVSVTFPNYPSTTGLDAIDYVLTDRWVCPPGRESQYVERTHRLRSGYLRYRPPESPPPVAPLPACARGFITFGLFQRPAKMNPHCWDLTAEVLRAVPGARLLIHYASADLDDPSSQTRAFVACELARRGVDAERASFRGPLSHRAHLELHSEIDIALDTFPYNGQTTTAECLWMGVPVVTQAGNTHVSRVGLEILDRLGLGEWVARDGAEYVAIAVKWGSDLERLERVRSSLRKRIAESTLSDGGSLTREVEAAYRAFWKHWCAGARRF